MKKKNRAFYHYFIPVIYAVFVYILWELTGTLVAYVVGKVMDNWEETLYSSYISMLFNEVLTYVCIVSQKSRFRKKRKKNMFLAAWGKKKNGIYCAVVVSSLGFGLCHYRNLLVGQNFADTTKQVLYAICFGMFLAALFIQTNHLFIPVLVHGLCNFSNFFMNEILGWNYTVWKYDDILQGVLAVFYLIAGLYVVYRSVQKKQNIRRKTEK